MFGGCDGANEVYWPLTILRFGFTNDVDVTPGLVLNVADCFAAAADDESDGAVGDEDLD